MGQLCCPDGALRQPSRFKETIQGLLFRVPLMGNVQALTKRSAVQKRKVGAGIGATPTWGYCVCSYHHRRNPREKVSSRFRININKHIAGFVSSAMNVHLPAQHHKKGPSGEGPIQTASFKERERRKLTLHSGHVFPDEHPRLMKTKGRFVLTDAKQAGDPGVFIALDIMK